MEDQRGLARQAAADPEAAIAELGGVRSLHVEVQRPPPPRTVETSAPRSAPRLRARRDRRHAQRLRRGAGALGAARRRRGARRRGGQLHLRRALPTHPGALLRDVHRRAADGGCRRGIAGARLAPFASTFAAFLTRAHDFVRMAAVSRADIKLAVRTPASPSARTAPPRWRSKTSR